MIQLKSEARDIVLRLKNKKYGYLSIGQFKHSIIFYDLTEYYYNYNGQWKTLERKIPTNSSWMTSWLYTRRERTYRLGYRAQIPVARRPNDGVLFPLTPPCWQRIREHDVKSLACRMSHHSFRVTRADVTCRCLCTCS